MADDAGFALSNALDELYASPPADFTALRTRLAQQAKKAGDAAAAATLRGSRKPTTAAWVVNVLALGGPARGELTDLGTRLREAHAAMDGDALRTLTGEQRRLVDRLATEGLRTAGVSRPTAALRDDVVSTLQAAIADPEVADRLGRLTTAEQWSGFGEFGAVSPKVAAAAKAAKPVTKATKEEPPEQKPDPAVARARADVAAAERTTAEAAAAVAELESDLDAARRRHREATRALDAARSAFADAESALEAADDAYRSGREAGQAAAEELEAARGRLAELVGTQDPGLLSR